MHKLLQLDNVTHRKVQHFIPAAHSKNKIIVAFMIHLTYGLHHVNFTLTTTHTVLPVDTVHRKQYYRVVWKEKYGYTQVNAAHIRKGTIAFVLFCYDIEYYIVIYIYYHPSENRTLYLIKEVYRKYILYFSTAYCIHNSSTPSP